MTVHLNNMGYNSSEDAPCTVCGERANYPFMRWDSYAKAGGSDITICRKCAQKIKRGFTADLIQLAAIQDLRDIGVLVDLERT